MPSLWLRALPTRLDPLHPPKVRIARFRQPRARKGFCGQEELQGGTRLADNPAAPVPLCDIKAQYRSLKPQIDAAVLRVLASGQAILGPEVAAFEKEMAEYLRRGLRRRLRLRDRRARARAARARHRPRRRGDRPAVHVLRDRRRVCRVGATPVFVDIDPLTFNIDPAQIEAKITPKTKAIMPVHLFGQCCDMDAIWDIAEEHAALRDRGRGPVVRQRLPGEAVRHARRPSRA